MTTHRLLIFPWCFSLLLTSTLFTLFRTNPGNTIPIVGQLLWNVKTLDKEEEEENTNMEGNENVVKRWKPLEETHVSSGETIREAAMVGAFDASFRLLAEFPQEHRERFFRKIASGQRSNDPNLKYVLGTFLKQRVSAMGLPEWVTEGILDKFFITAELPK